MKAGLVSLAALAALASAASPARADDGGSAAETLFQEARSLTAAGRYADACPKLEQSYALEPAVGTQFNLADCYEHVGRTASAYRLFGEVARIARAAGKFERERSARDRAAALEPKLPRVRVVVSSPAPGQTLRVDDAVIDPVAPGGAPATGLPLDPGPHRVRATAPGRRDWERALTAEEGAAVEVTVPELVDPNPREREPPPPSRQRTLAIAVAGAGVAGVAFGAVAGAIAIAERSRAERDCPKDTFQFRCPTQDGASAWNTAGTWGNVSTVAFVVGGAIAGTAAVLWLTAPRAHARARVGVTASGLRLAGSF